MSGAKFDSKLYAEVFSRVPWLVRDIESHLATVSDAGVVSLQRIRSHLITEKAPSDEQIIEVLLALRSLNVIDTLSRLNKTVFMQTAQFREGLRVGIEFGQNSMNAQEETLELCVTPPQELNYFRESLADLPNLAYVLKDLIAAASERIVLCFPFWDESTTMDIINLLERRLSDGVKVDIITRNLSAESVSEQILSLQRRFSTCNILTWQRRTSIGRNSNSFHFKAIIVDGGAKAYLGSANMTATSMKYNMELGVILSGEVSYRLARLIDEVLSLI